VFGHLGKCNNWEWCLDIFLGIQNTVIGVQTNWCVGNPGIDFQNTLQETIEFQISNIGVCNFQWTNGMFETLAWIFKTLCKWPLSFKIPVLEFAISNKPNGMLETLTWIFKTRFVVTARISHLIRIWRSVRIRTARLLNAALALSVGYPAPAE